MTVKVVTVVYLKSYFCSYSSELIYEIQIIESSLLLNIFPQKMTTLRNKRRLAAASKETQKKHPRNGQSRNTSVRAIIEEHITQVSEEIEGRATKKTVPGTQQDHAIQYLSIQQFNWLRPRSGLLQRVFLNYIKPILHLHVSITSKPFKALKQS